MRLSERRRPSKPSEPTPPGESARRRSRRTASRGASRASDPWPSASADTQYRDVTGLQGVVYAWAVVARGDVVDADHEACPGQAIRVYHADELDDEPAQGLPEVCEAHAEALPDGWIRLTWTHADGDYAVYRGLAEGDRLTRAARVSGGETFNLIPGVTYSFLVTAWDPEAQEDVARCNFVEVTAIPYFGNPALAALAGVGAIGAVVMLRRRGGA